MLPVTDHYRTQYHADDEDYYPPVNGQSEEQSSEKEYKQLPYKPYKRNSEYKYKRYDEYVSDYFKNFSHN